MKEIKRKFTLSYGEYVSADRLRLCSSALNRYFVLDGARTIYVTVTTEKPKSDYLTLYRGPQGGYRELYGKNGNVKEAMYHETGSFLSQTFFEYEYSGPLYVWIEY